MKKPREVEDENDEPFIFNNMKQTRIGHIVETSKDEEELEEEIQGNKLHEEYAIEVPSNPNVEVWEEI